MSTKRTTARKKTGGDLRKQAIAEIDARLDGKAKAPAKKKAAGKTKKGGRGKGGSAARDRHALAEFFPMPSGTRKRTKAAKTTKPKAAKATKPAKASKPAKEKRASGLDLAAKVLVESKEALNAKTIAERAIAAGWKTNGKTPHATLYAAIVREISDKGNDARFKKTDRGLFTSCVPGKKGA